MLFRSIPQRPVLPPQVHPAPLAKREHATEEREYAPSEDGRRPGVRKPTEKVVERTEEYKSLALLRDHALGEALRAGFDPGEDVRARRDGLCLEEVL